MDTIGTLLASSINNEPTLSKMGLNLVEHTATNAKSLVGVTHKYIFINNHDRRIEFIYSPEPAADDFLLVYIINTLSGEGFSLQDWLSFHEIAIDDDPFRLGIYPGTLHEKIQGFVHFVNGVISHKELANILRGRIWVDIPYDWGELR